jgi:hypothetical protein
LDFFFCHDGPDACDETLSGTGRLYPQAKFEYKVVANTGHLLMLQDAAERERVEQTAQMLLTLSQLSDEEVAAMLE